MLVSPDDLDVLPAGDVTLADGWHRPPSAPRHLGILGQQRYRPQRARLGFAHERMFAHTAGRMYNRFVTSRDVYIDSS